MLLPTGPTSRGAVPLAAGLADAMDELREFSRGIHPAILSEGGLRPGAAHARPPVTRYRSNLMSQLDARYPEPIEIAAYYVVSEALANAAKHARASIVHVDLDTPDHSIALGDPRRGSVAPTPPGGPG